MRKLFLLAVACFMAVAAYSAEPRKFYFLHYEGQEDKPLGSWFVVDLDKMNCIYDGDSDGTSLIKNYKKDGNTEVSDVYMKDDPNYLIEKMEITTTEEKTTLVRYYQGTQKEQPVVIGSKEELDALYEKAYGSASSEEAGKNAPASPIDKVKNKVTGGVKNLLNKAKSAVKKK